MTVRRFHHLRSLLRPLAAGLAMLALAAPLAMARPALDPAPTFRRPAPAAAPVVRTAEPGFDWGSAAVGAGGAGALLVLLAAGGVVYVSRDRMRTVR